MGHSSGAQTSLLGGKRVLRVGTRWVKWADSRNQVVQRCLQSWPNIFININILSLPLSPSISGFSLFPQRFPSVSKSPWQQDTTPRPVS